MSSREDYTVPPKITLDDWNRFASQFKVFDDGIGFNKIYSKTSEKEINLGDIASYIIFKDGDLIKAKNGKTGQVEFSGSDAATVIQQVIDAVYDAGGGRVFIKAGTYSINSTITLKSNVSLVGENPNSTILLGTCEPIIEFGADEEKMELSGLKIRSDVENPSYPAIAIKAGSAVIWIWNCIIDATAIGRLGHGIQIRSASRVRIRDCWIWGAKGNGIRLVADLGNVWEVWIENVDITDLASGSYGIFMDGVGNVLDAIWVTNVNILGGSPDYGIYIYRAGGGLIHLVGCAVEDAKVQSVWIRESPHVRLVNCWAGRGDSGDPQFNFLISDNSDDVTLTGCLAVKADEHGIRIYTSKRVKVIGCYAIDNGQAYPGERDGINIADSTDCIVMGNVAFDTQASKTQRYGVNEEGSSDYNIITSNSCRGNATGGISTVGTNTIKANNIGV